MKVKTIVYRKVTRERFIELLGRIGYRVSRQSSDGSYMLIRLPESDESTGYWLFRDSLEHKLDNFRGGAAFFFKDCNLEDDRQGTITIIGKTNKSIFCSFHNFKVNKENLAQLTAIKLRENK